MKRRTSESMNIILFSLFLSFRNWYVFHHQRQSKKEKNNSYEKYKLLKVQWNVIEDKKKMKVTITYDDDAKVEISEKKTYMNGMSI